MSAPCLPGSALAPSPGVRRWGALSIQIACLHSVAAGAVRPALEEGCTIPWETRDEMTALLAEVIEFDGFPSEGLADLAERGRRRTFRAGDELLRQGEASASRHVIVRGCVRLEQGHPDLTGQVELVELERAEVVGAIGLLDGRPSRAFAVATSDTETLELDAPIVAGAVLRYPEQSVTLLHTLSRQLRNAEELATEVAHRGWDRPRV
jgi:CRP-like cAMP-binding protein